MPIRKSLMLSAVTLTLLCMTAARGQQAESASAGLSPMDYIEIQQLVARYAYALDTGGNNGNDYADLFADDGVFVGMNQGTRGRSYRGHETLAGLARGGPRGVGYVSHFISNVVIEPTEHGAKGRQYAVIAAIGEDGQPSEVTHGGHYEDVYVRTETGWRFQSRVFYASEGGPTPRQLEFPPLEAPAGGR